MMIMKGRGRGEEKVDHMKEKERLEKGEVEKVYITVEI